MRQYRCYNQICLSQDHMLCKRKETAHVTPHLLQHIPQWPGYTSPRRLQTVRV